MAKTNTLMRRSRTFETPRGARFSLRAFEKRILKYYPKHFRIFENSRLSQDDRFWNYKQDDPKMELAEDYSPNQRILRRYRADFFQSFQAYYEYKSPQPTRIPHNIKNLVIREGSGVFLKKLIKQNKRLEYLTLHPPRWGDYDAIIRFLKYSKSLRSIKFERTLPLLSEKICRKMLRNWSNSMQRVEILAYALQSRKNFTRVMEMILQYPKLKEFRFLSQTNDKLSYFPLVKLQEKNICYDVRLSIEEDCLRKQQPEFKAIDCLVLSHRDFEYKTDESCRLDWKIQDISPKALHLDHLPSSPFAVQLLLPLFQNLSYLDLSFTPERSDYSSLGSLNNLKSLSFDMRNASSLKDFFRYFHENVARNTKLEIVLVTGNFDLKEGKEYADDLIQFFETCSNTLRKASFEFHTFHTECFEYLCEVLSKLNHLKSLNVFLRCEYLECVEQIESLGKIISGMQSLEELSFKIKDARFGKQKVSIAVPSQLKKLSIGRDTCNSIFDLTKTLLPLSNLVYLELESDRFYSMDLSKSFDKLKLLEVLVLKEVEISYGVLRMKEKLESLMKQFLDFKLIVFTNTGCGETIVLRRNYPWPEIEKICQGLCLEKCLKMSYIKSYV